MSGLFKSWIVCLLFTVALLATFRCGVKGPPIAPVASAAETSDPAERASPSPSISPEALDQPFRSAPTPRTVAPREMTRARKKPAPAPAPSPSPSVSEGTEE